ncbi:MAG: PilZ domain-containing protein [Candidatus Schekmanbacteria bacterium]|nr:MAG: PilZ domain-containing protein [Candidatus Schekmanbacteria bacterium]
MIKKEDFEKYLPDIVELNLASENIKDLFLEVSERIVTSDKVCNQQAARREFAIISKQWERLKESLVKDGTDFISNGVFPFTINYCPFLYISTSLLFIGRLNKGIDLGIQGIPPIKIICIMLFHSVESVDKNKKIDGEMDKFNLYWNNLLKNQSFIEGFMNIESSERFLELVSMTHSYLEKRRYPRYSIHSIAYCNTISEEDMLEKKEKVEVKNISLSGLLLQHNNPFQVEDHVGVNLMLEDKVIYMSGKVCRCHEIEEGERKVYSSGIDITDISKENRLIMEEYLSRLQ